MIAISDDLKHKINNIPPLPGIYKMLDSRGNIIYVGKSKCLKKRVKSYFMKDHKWEKVKKMVALIRDIDYIVTDTHLDARLLECSLIKTIQPPFNAQMKNDSRYAYLQVKEYNPHNALAVVHERCDYSYGPLRSKHMLIELTQLLKNLYPIHFDGVRYEFTYHIFPITMDKDTFEQNQKVLIDLFTSEEKLNLMVQQLRDKMITAASTYHYENASIYRDIIHGLEYVKHGINGYRNLFSKKLVLRVPTQDGIKLFYINAGNILLTKKYKRISSLDKYLKNFIEKGNAIKYSNTMKINDKASIDYRDILYSEINSLPEDMIVFVE